MARHCRPSRYSETAHFSPGSTVHCALHISPQRLTVETRSAESLLYTARVGELVIQIGADRLLVLHISNSLMIGEWDSSDFCKRVSVSFLEPRPPSRQLRRIECNTRRISR